MNKNVIRKVGIGLVAVGVVGIFVGGGTEGNAIEIVSGVFAVIGTVVALIKRG
jgi:hypothetical protein